MALSASRLGTATLVSPGSTTVVYTVPAGKRTILRDARLFKRSASTGIARLSAVAAGNVDAVGLLTSTALPIDTALIMQDGFVVLEAGDILRVYSQSGEITVWLSGHEFTL